MKISNPLITKALGLFGATLIRGWTATLDYRIVYQDPTVDPVHPLCRPRALYVLWHENLIYPLGVRGRNMAVLISQHRDGELITQVLRHLGFKVIRGSSTRGGIAAVRRVMRWGGGGVLGSRSGEGTGDKDSPPHHLTTSQPHHVTTPPPLHLIITPDGPRGPRRQLEKGAIFLAARLHIPIVCMGFAFDRPWRLSSWDQFAIPRPFSRARAVISGYLDIAPVGQTGMSARQTGMSAPPPVPPTQITRDFLEYNRLRVEQVLNQVTQESEHWAQTGNRKPGEMPLLRNELSLAQAWEPEAPARALAGASRCGPGLGNRNGERLAS
jgi:lysophospholipid acyltransferase (LPLAT)-like uncharacterized protein